MICPRCESDAVSLMAKAPLDNAWEVYICDVCKYSYRNTEPERRRNPELYDARFKIDPEKIGAMGVIPPIPPLERK